MTDVELVSQRAYATHRGVSHTAVQRAIKAGRLAKSVHLKPSGRFHGIDLALADREWDELTDPTKPTGVDPEPKPSRESDGQTLIPGVEASPAPATVAAPKDEETLEAKRQAVRSASRRTKFAAMEAQIDFEEKAGRLGEIAEMERTYFEIARTTRDLIIAISSRIAPIVAAEDDELEVRRILDLELRQALQTVASKVKSIRGREAS